MASCLVQVLVCPADASLLPAGCTHVPIGEAEIARPPGELPFSSEYLGLEDAKGFSWQGHVHLLGTVNVEKKGASSSW